MSECFGEQLPNFLPHPVLKRFISEKLGEFWRLIEVLVDESFQTIHARLFNNDKHISSDDILLLKLLPTFRRVGKLYLEEKKQIVRNQFQEMIRIEKIEPYTLNHYYMGKINQFREHEVERKLETSKDKHVSGKATGRKYDDNNDDDDYASLFNAISNDDCAAQDMVISIYAYWKVLVKRCIDNVALSLRAACVFDTCSGITDRLRQIPSEQINFVDQHLSEDQGIQRRRQQLQKRKEQLEKVVTILENDTMTNDIPANESSPSMSLDRMVANLDCTSLHDNIYADS